MEDSHIAADALVDLVHGRGALAADQTAHLAACPSCRDALAVVRAGRAWAAGAPAPASRVASAPHEVDDERLVAYVAGLDEAPARAELEAHLATCAACRAEVDALRGDHAAWTTGAAAPAPRAEVVALPQRGRAARVALALGGVVAAAAAALVIARAPDPVGELTDAARFPVVATEGARGDAAPVILFDGTVYVPAGAGYRAAAELLPSRSDVACARGDVVLLDVVVSAPPLHKAEVDRHSLWYVPPSGTPRRIDLATARGDAAKLRAGGPDAGRPGFAFGLDDVPGSHVFVAALTPGETGDAAWLEQARRGEIPGAVVRLLRCITAAR